MRMAAILEYDGSAFRGWQNQSHVPCGQLPVEAAFSRVALVLLLVRSLVV